MQQIFIELWSFKGRWRELSIEERGAYIDKLVPTIKEAQAKGIEVMAWGYNEADIDRRIDYDVFALYRLPNKEALKALQASIAQSGWYEYFEQANAGGAAQSPPGILYDHVMLNPAPSFEDISPEEQGARIGVPVKGLNLSTLQMGEGRPVVFLHGEIGQAYMWRNVMPYVAKVGHAIALDQIGAGRSDKLPHSHDDAYSFNIHYDYLEAFLKEIGVEERVIFVGQDWGCNLAFEWAMRHPGKVAGIAYCESVSPPFEWDDWSPMIQPAFRKMLSDEGEQFQLKENGFVNSLPIGVLRQMSQQEIDRYVAPYAEAGEARRPPLDWARQVPLGGRRPEIAAQITAHHDYMKNSEFPKLLFRGEPGGLTVGRRYELLREWRNQEEVTVRGIHWLTEDDPHIIGRNLADWIARISAKAVE